jgi:integrase
MGHSSINTTLAIYTHLAAGRMEDALSSVREIFKERGAI